MKSWPQGQRGPDLERLLLSSDDLRGQVTRHQCPRWDHETCPGLDSDQQGCTAALSPAGTQALPSSPEAVTAGAGVGKVCCVNTVHVSRGRNSNPDACRAQCPFKPTVCMDQALQKRQPPPPPSTCGKDSQDAELWATGPGTPESASRGHRASHGPGKVDAAPRLPGAPCPRPGPVRRPRGPPQGQPSRLLPDPWPARPTLVGPGSSTAWPPHSSARPPRGLGGQTALFLLLPRPAELGATPSSAGDAVQTGPSLGTAEQAKCRSAPATQAWNDRWPPWAGKGSHRGRAEAAVAAGHSGLCR